VSLAARLISQWVLQFAVEVMLYCVVCGTVSHVVLCRVSYCVTCHSVSCVVIDAQRMSRMSTIKTVTAATVMLLPVLMLVMMMMMMITVLTVTAPSLLSPPLPTSQLPLTYSVLIHHIQYKKYAGLVGMSSNRELI